MSGKPEIGDRKTEVGNTRTNPPPRGCGETKKEVFRQVYDFVRGEPAFEQFTEEELSWLLAIYLKHDWLGTVTLEGILMGVGLGRPVSLEQAEARPHDCWAHDDEGPVLWVTLVKSKSGNPMLSRRIIRQLWRQMILRFGRRPYVAFERIGRDSRPVRQAQGRPRLYTLTQLERKLFDGQHP